MSDKKRLLLITSVVALAETIVEILPDYEVIVRMTIDDGLECVKSGDSIDAVLLDTMVAGRSTLEQFDTIEPVLRGIPIVAMSGGTSDTGWKILQRNKRIFGFLPKPFPQPFIKTLGDIIAAAIAAAETSEFSMLDNDGDGDPLKWSDGNRDVHVNFVSDPIVDPHARAIARYVLYDGDGAKNSE